MFSLAWKNITRRLGGSLMTALIAFIAVFVLATSLAVVASLENGLRLSRERLGADIMVRSRRGIWQCVRGALLRRASQRVLAG